MSARLPRNFKLGIRSRLYHSPKTQVPDDLINLQNLSYSLGSMKRDYDNIDFREIADLTIIGKRIVYYAIAKNQNLDGKKQRGYLIFDRGG